jgi:hypothetical protein
MLISDALATLRYLPNKFKQMTVQQVADDGAAYGRYRFTEWVRLNHQKLRALLE